MHIRNVDLNLLKVFDAVYRERQTIRAADSLALSQSAVSHALSRLRTLFEDPLFTRTANGLQPTPVALRLAGPIADAMSSIGTALHRGHQFDPATSSLTFRVGMPDPVSFYLLPRLHRELQRQAPGVNLRIRPLPHGPQRFLALGSAEVDLVVMVSSQGVTPSLPPDIEAQLLFEDKLACVLDRRSRIGAERLTPQRYAAARHVAFARSDDFNSFIDESLGEAGLRRRIALVVPYWSAIPRTIEGSELVWTTMSRFARDAARGGPLRVVPCPFPKWRHSVTQAWHQRSREDVAHRWLRGLIQEVMQGSEARPRIGRSSRASRRTDAASAGRGA